MSGLLADDEADLGRPARRGRHRPDAPRPRLAEGALEHAAQFTWERHGPRDPRRRWPTRPSGAGRGGAGAAWRAGLSRPSRRRPTPPTGARDAPPASAHLPTLLLAAVIYVPLLLTNRARSAPTPSRTCTSTPAGCSAGPASMWDPNVGMGTVTHQNIGYLWPMGPCYWLFEHARRPRLGGPAALARAILFLAGLGVRYLLHALGQTRPAASPRRPSSTPCSPYVLTLGRAHLGHPAALRRPAVADRASPCWRCGRGGWRYPALFALIVATIGTRQRHRPGPRRRRPAAVDLRTRCSIAREVQPAQAARPSSAGSACSPSAARCGGSPACGPRAATASTSSATPRPPATVGDGVLGARGAARPRLLVLLRRRPLGPWIEPSRRLHPATPCSSSSPTLLTDPRRCIGAAIVRWRDRAFFVAAARHRRSSSPSAPTRRTDPPLARPGLQGVPRLRLGLAMRSLPRAVPLVALGAGRASSGAAWRRWRRRPRSAGPAAARPCGMCRSPSLAPAAAVDRPDGRPTTSTATRTSPPTGTRPPPRPRRTRRSTTPGCSEVPGADFASYRWGNTVDPITPGLMDRPYVARELIPYGSPPRPTCSTPLDRRCRRACSTRRRRPHRPAHGRGRHRRALRPRVRALQHRPAAAAVATLLDRARPRRPVGFGGTDPERPAAPAAAARRGRAATPNSTARSPPRSASCRSTTPCRSCAPSRPSGRCSWPATARAWSSRRAPGCSTATSWSSTPRRFADDPDGADGAVDRDAVARAHRHQPRAGARWGTVRETDGYTEAPARSRCRRPQRPATRRLPGRRRRQPAIRVPTRSRRWAAPRSTVTTATRSPTRPRTGRRTPSTATPTARARLAHRRLRQRHRREAAHPLRRADHQRRALRAPGPGRRPQPLHHRGDDHASTARTRSPFRSVETRACRGARSLDAGEAHLLDARDRDRQHRSGLERRYDNMAAVGFAEINPKPGDADWPSGDESSASPAASSRRAGQASDDNGRWPILLTRHAHRRHELGAHRRGADAWPASGTSRPRGTFSVSGKARLSPVRARQRASTTCRRDPRRRPRAA